MHCIFDLTLNGFLGMYDSDKRSSYTCYESDQDLPYCFHGIENAIKINISFSGNSAVAGSAIFGQEIDKTLSKLMLYFQDTVKVILLQLQTYSSTY